MENGQRTMKRQKLVPPDGGWGWMVVIGTAAYNIFNQSLISVYGLLYGDKIESMGYNTKGAAFVLSIVMFFANFSGPIAGAAIKLTSPRIVAVAGASLTSCGILLSGFISNIWHLAITYGVCLGLGLGFVRISTFVVINSYFKSKKSRAVSLASIGTGFGQTIMPHIVRYLLENVGFRMTCLYLAALSMNGICGVLLLQPVEWHMKKHKEKVYIDEIKHLLDKQKDVGGDKDKKENNTHTANHPNLDIVANEQGTKVITIPVQAQKKSVFKRIYDLFDIALLTNPRFLIVIVGIPLAISSIQNFTMVFPFFLQKVAKLSKQETANCMSTVAILDILGRIILSTVQDKYKITARCMLIMTSAWIILFRQILVFQTSLPVLMVLSGLYGFGKSMVMVGRNIVISENCKMEQVPAAVGLGMLSAGIITPPLIYCLGWIRDATDSFLACIAAQNILLFIVIVTWGLDLLWLKYKERRKRHVEQIELS